MAEEEVVAHAGREVEEALANCEVGCVCGHVAHLVETGCVLVVVGFVGQEEHHSMALGQEVVAWVVTGQHDEALLLLLLLLLVSVCGSVIALSLVHPGY